MIRRLLLSLSLLLVPVLYVSAPAVHAADVFSQEVCERQAAKDSAVCKDKNLQTDANGNVENPLTGPNGILTMIIQILAVIAGIVAVIMIIAAGLKFITSGNNPQEVANARERLIYAIVGVVVAVLAQSLVLFVLKKI